MKIIYIITGLSLGGAEVTTIDIANRMATRGHEVLILPIINCNEVQNNINQKIEVRTLGMRKNPFSFIKAICFAKKIIKEFKPDVVHANMVHANIFSRILRLFVPMKKLICTAHNINEGEFLRMIAYRLTDSLSDVNTNVSEEATNFYIKNKWFSAGKSICVHNGIDLATFHKDTTFRNTVRKQYGIDSDEFLFLNVGRLTEAKDQSNLLQAFAKIGHGKLMIVGKGEKENELKLLTKELGVEKDVIFAGAHPDIQSYYNAADCYVCSSAWEGYSLVLCEAMACGMPLISTEAGGCTEIVDQPQYMVPIKNSDALFKKMSNIINKSDEERAIIGNKNAILAKKYDIENIISYWEKIYTDRT